MFLQSRGVSFKILASKPVHLWTILLLKNNEINCSVIIWAFANSILTPIIRFVRPPFFKSVVHELWFLHRTKGGEVILYPQDEYLTKENKIVYPNCVSYRFTQ